MPEIAEVKTFVDSLNETYKGKTLYGINVIGGRFLKDIGKIRPLNSVINDLEELSFPLFDAQFNCKGKFIYWSFKHDIHFFFTLGMTGSFSREKTRHSALAFNFGQHYLYFTDPRHFGTFKIPHKSALKVKLNSLGWDPLQEPLNDANKNYILIKLGKKENKTVAEVLLDQSIFAGLGNYLRSEILYYCKIHPNRLVKDLKYSEIYDIIASFKRIAEEAYKHRGATLATYKDVNGNIGNFSNMLKVYGKDKDSFGNEVEKLTAKDGRTVHYVKDIQK